MANQGVPAISMQVTFSRLAQRANQLRRHYIGPSVPMALNDQCRLQSQEKEQPRIVG